VTGNCHASHVWKGDTASVLPVSYNLKYGILAFFLKSMKSIKCLITLPLILFLTSGVYSVERIKMATTTSTENSGLLDVLLPPFESRFGVRVDVIAVGTGKALKLGENGDVDVVLVHSRDVEDEFVREGFGVNRRDVMYNDFVIVGPFDDPAGVGGSSDVVHVFKKLYRNKTPFVSRGDDSGTHMKEKKLWKISGIEPEGEWYIETGQGMGATLIIASEKRAYCLCDRGTFAAYKDKLELAVLSEGDNRLHNPYGIIAVNPAKHPHVKYVYAMALVGWVTSSEGQKIIAEYKKSGEILFCPVTVEKQ
jgi:tungstate transport system substrate-binding protein